LFFGEYTLLVLKRLSVKAQKQSVLKDLPGTKDLELRIDLLSQTPKKIKRKGAKAQRDHLKIRKI
jgi:hypothetical protein